jgi:hypothetical protein
MTHLRKTMLEELQRRNYANTTSRRYLRFVERFAQHPIPEQAHLQRSRDLGARMELARQI